MNDPALLTGVTLGAAIVVVNLVLLITALVLIVNAAERKRDAKDDARERKFEDAVKDFKKLVLLAIAGRSELEKKVNDSEERINDHSGTLAELKERLAAIDGRV